MPLAKIIPGRPAQTIDEVIQQLEQLIAECIDTNDRIGYFAALYHKVTVRVREGILNQEFDNGARMERLDVIFANRYLWAVQQYRNQQAPSGSWQAAFDATQQRSTLVLQHLLLGMNAHINLDLGIAAVEAANRNDLRSIRNDFNAINTILGSLIFEVMNEINRVSPLLSLFGFHATNESILIQFSITNARDGAWSFAEDLSSKIGKPTWEWTQCINNRDGIIQKLGLSLLKPKGLIRITMWIIHLFEWKNPARVIRAFYKYEKKYITVNTEA
ncbi:hypothetical protein D3H65_12550 [Paraflavitalea soli]|uniref:Uncharacterized protein n=1 Tax=Paraflavitalea soli TaxID=2315862 RepID=A0A3B7MJY3_9BACT|nr:DUF5995 family protein [Paraflavitalea soli]AXY74762.1 hypothetical protein D3H65_12550 [Paraflavitalea soli]